jgi:hypothetical protein
MVGESMKKKGNRKKTKLNLSFNRKSRGGISETEE